MDSKELTSLLQNPATINAAHTTALEEVLVRYPYFQAARALHLKGLRNENSLHYNKELKVTAAYTIDRGVLFDYITSEVFDQNEIADQIKKQEQSDKEFIAEIPESRPEEVPLALNEALKEKLREKEFQNLSNLPEKDSSPPSVPSEDQESDLELGKPLLFDRSENHSFSEWLKLTTAKPVERSKSPEPAFDERIRKFELIDEFILKSPKIDPTQPTRKTNLAEERATTPDALMTETLARVYLEQKNYKKAIQAYKILILKNPEKSGFFADQIRAIEKIKEQNS